MIITPLTGAVAKYSDEHVYVCVCVSVCPPGYLRNHSRILTNFLHAAYRQWLGAPPAG